MRSFLIEWNNTFVLDKSYRSSNNIKFNSPDHRQSCQIDIYLEHLEDEIFKEHLEFSVETERKKDSYSKGIWMEEKKIDEAELAAIFDNIDIELIEQ